MSTIFNTMETTESGDIQHREVVLEQLPEFDSVRERFETEFPAFVREQKIKAVIEALQEELGAASTLQMPKLVSDVMKRLDDTALIEKPYVFISVNPKVLI